MHLSRSYTNKILEDTSLQCFSLLLRQMGYLITQCGHLLSYLMMGVTDCFRIVAGSKVPGRPV